MRKVPEVPSQASGVVDTTLPWETICTPLAVRHTTASLCAATAASTGQPASTVASSPYTSAGSSDARICAWKWRVRKHRWGASEALYHRAKES